MPPSQKNKLRKGTMSFADISVKTLLVGEGEARITLAGAVKTGDLVGVNATNGWVKAQGASTAVKAQFVAGEAGASGGKITVFRRALLRAAYGAVAGEIGDPLYLGDTAGSVSTSAGSITQVVGYIASATDIVLEVPYPLEGAAAGWLTLDGVLYMAAGTYETPAVNTAGGTGQVEFHSLWTKMTHATARGYGHRVSLELTGVSSRTSNAGRFELWLSAPSGQTQGGGAAIHAAAYLGVGNTGHAGALAGLNASLVVDEEERSCAGTYGAIYLQTEIKTGNTLQESAFILARDAGAVKAEYFLYILQAAAANSMVRALTPGATAAMTLTINVNGVDYFVLLSETAT